MSNVHPPLRSLDSTSSLSNEHWGTVEGLEVVDVLFPALSVYARDRCPTPESLCSFVMRHEYPRLSEIQRVEQYYTDTGVIYRLWIKRGLCPIRFTGGMKCVLCGSVHVPG